MGDSFVTKSLISSITLVPYPIATVISLITATLIRAKQAKYAALEAFDLSMFITFNEPDKSAITKIDIINELDFESSSNNKSNM